MVLAGSEGVGFSDDSVEFPGGEEVLGGCEGVAVTDEPVELSGREVVLGGCGGVGFTDELVEFPGRVELLGGCVGVGVTDELVDGSCVEVELPCAKMTGAKRTALARSEMERTNFCEAMMGVFQCTF